MLKCSVIWRPSAPVAHVVCVLVGFEGFKDDSVLGKLNDFFDWVVFRRMGHDTRTWKCLNSGGRWCSLVAPSLCGEDRGAASVERCLGSAGGLLLQTTWCVNLWWMTCFLKILLETHGCCSRPLELDGDSGSSLVLLLGVGGGTVAG